MMPRFVVMKEVRRESNDEIDIKRVKGYSARRKMEARS